MSDSIPPARPIASGRRVSQRRADDPSPPDILGDSPGGDRRAPAKGAADDHPIAKALVRVSATTDAPASPLESFVAFAAQILGQGGQKRGLRGGPETLDHARTAYLETEYSGPSDRRPRVGRITRTEI